MNSPFKALNISIVLITIICLNYSTIFWIGSVEQYDALKRQSFILFFLNRFLLNMIVIFTFLFLNLSINLILGQAFRKGLSLKKVLFFDFLFLIFVSIVMIILRNF